MSVTSIHRQVEAARQGTLARVIARLPSGWAVLGPLFVFRFVYDLYAALPRETLVLSNNESPSRRRESRPAPRSS